LKKNILGVVGCILGFLGLALPWWTMDITLNNLHVGTTAYLYQVATSSGNSSYNIVSLGWYTVTPLVLLLVGSILVLIASLLFENGRIILLIGAVLSLLALVLFPVGLQASFSSLSGISSLFGGIGVFSSGSMSILGYSMTFSTYLTFGFWLSAVAVFFMFMAWVRYPEEDFMEEEQREPEQVYRPSPYERRPVRRGYP
jgi:hypothetical protein